MKELFAELKDIFDLKTEIAKTEVIVWQRLASAVGRAARQAEKTTNGNTPLKSVQAPQITVIQPERTGRYLTAKQAAKYLGIGMTSLYAMRKTGVLKYVTIGNSPRYRIDDLEAIAINYNEGKRQN